MAAAILGAYIERWARKWAPDVLALFIVPTLTVLITGVATLFVLMPAAGWVSVQIGVAATWLLTTTGVFAGFVLGGLFLPLVMTGLHQTLTPIHATLIEQVGYTILLPVLAMGGAGQIGERHRHLLPAASQHQHRPHHQGCAARRVPGRRGAADLRRHPAAGPPVHHRLHRRRVRRCRHRAVRPARLHHRLGRHRRQRPVPVPAARRQPRLGRRSPGIRLRADRRLHRRVRGDLVLRVLPRPDGPLEHRRHHRRRAGARRRGTRRNRRPGRSDPRTRWITPPRSLTTIGPLRLATRLAPGRPGGAITADKWPGQLRMIDPAMWPEDTGVDRRSPPHQGLSISHSRDPRHPEHTGRSKQNGRQIRDPGASRAGHRHRACRAMGCRVAPPRSTHDPPGTPSTRSREMPNRWLRGRPVRFAMSSVHPADHRREQRAIAPPGRRRTGGQEAVLTRNDCRSAGARGWQHR